MYFTTFCYNDQQMGASEPKWVKSDYIQYGINSLRLGDLQIFLTSGLYERNQLHNLKIVNKILIFEYKNKDEI